MKRNDPRPQAAAPPGSRAARRALRSVPLWCYLLALAGWLAVCTATLAGDGLAAARGDMPRLTLTMAEMEQLDVEQTDTDVWRAVTADPQLRWQNTAGIRLRWVVLTAAYDLAPREICLYYKTDPAQEFSSEQRVYAQQQPDGSYSFLLPDVQVCALRLDPCSYYCTITGFSLTLNAAMPLWRYYLPGWWQLFQLLLYPGLAACALRLALDAWAALRARRAPPPAGQPATTERAAQPSGEYMGGQ